MISLKFSHTFSTGQTEFEVGAVDTTKSSKIRGKFILNTWNKKKILRFLLDKVEGDECYEMTVYSPKLESGERTILASSFTSTVTFTPETQSIHKAVCIVSFQLSFFKQPREDTMACFIAYCKNNPEMLMTFKCGNVEIKAVTKLMCCKSVVIESVMNKDPATKTIDITEFSPDAVQKMVEYCETDEVRSIAGLEMELVKIANYFNMDSLKIYLALMLQPLLTIQNVLSTYQFAVNFNNPNLADKCVKFARAKGNRFFMGVALTDVDPIFVKQFWAKVQDKVLS